MIKSNQAPFNKFPKFILLNFPMEWNLRIELIVIFTKAFSLGVAALHWDPSFSILSKSIFSKSAFIGVVIYCL